MKNLWLMISLALTGVQAHAGQVSCYSEDGQSRVNIPFTRVGAAISGEVTYVVSAGNRVVSGILRPSDFQIAQYKQSSYELMLMGTDKDQMFVGVELRTTNKNSKPGIYMGKLSARESVTTKTAVSVDIRCDVEND